MSKRTKLLLKANNELEKQIKNDDNRQVLTDIVIYIHSANISPYYQEVVRRDIWEMIIEGEKRGETAGEVIGEDYKLFCDNVIMEIPKLSSKERLLSLVRDMLLPVVVLMTIWFTFCIIEQIIGVSSWPYFTVTFGNAISAGLIIVAAFFIFYIISKNSFKNDIIINKKIFWTVFTALLICICVNTFLKYSLFQIHILIAAAVIIALFFIYKTLDIKIDNC